MKSKPWVILKIGGMSPPPSCLKPRKYETRAAARLAALDVIEAYWSRFIVNGVVDGELAGGVSHRVAVGMRDKAGNLLVSDSGLVVTVHQYAHDEGLTISFTFENAKSNNAN